MLVARTIGMYSRAPAAALATTSVRPTARRSGITMPPAPAACAVRVMAPRLCGSSNPSSTTNNCAAGATSSSCAYFWGAPTATTPWCAGVPAMRSSPARSSKRTDTDARRAKSMISCNRTLAAPLATRMRSSGRPAFKLSSTGLIPLRTAIKPLLLGLEIQPVVKPIGEVGQRCDQGHLDDLLVVEMLGQRVARFRAVTSACQLSGILDCGAFGGAEAAVLAALERAHFIFRDARLAA